MFDYNLYDEEEKTPIKNKYNLVSKSSKVVKN